MIIYVFDGPVDEKYMRSPVDSADCTPGSIDAGGEGEKGASLVEFALVFPLLLLMLVGIVTAAQAWNYSNTIEHAAREAARAGATMRPFDASAEQAVRDVVDRNLEMAGIDPGDVASCIKKNDDPCGLDPSNLITDEAVGVVLILPAHSMDFVFFSYDVDLESRAVARWER